jgi:hypothetical protein
MADSVGPKLLATLDFLLLARDACAADDPLAVRAVFGV